MLEKFDPSRYALSKFGLNIDAYLYGMGADEEVGESDYGSWYGLFTGPFEPSADDIIEFDLTDDDIQYLSHMAGAILCEDSQGSVASWHYEKRATLDQKWKLVQAFDSPKCPICGEVTEEDVDICKDCSESEDEE